MRRRARRALLLAWTLPLLLSWTPAAPETATTSARSATSATATTLSADSRQEETAAGAAQQVWAWRWPLQAQEVRRAQLLRRELRGLFRDHLTDAELLGIAERDPAKRRRYAYMVAANRELALRRLLAFDDEVVRAHRHLREAGAQGGAVQLPAQGAGEGVVPPQTQGAGIQGAEAWRGRAR